MLVETSAIVEFLTNGPLATDVAAKIETAGTRFHVAPTIEFEATVVLASMLKCSVEAANEQVMDLVRELDAERMIVTPEIGEEALKAFAKYGKGRGHPAQLNFGDCFSYALAKFAGVPLLFVGNDFSKTDLA